MPPCQSGGISQIRHAPPPGLSPFPKPKREVCINARSAWAVRFFFAHGHRNGRAIYFAAERQICRAFHRQAGGVCRPLPPHPYHGEDLPKSVPGPAMHPKGPCSAPPRGYRPPRCSAEKPGPPPTKQQQAQREHAAPACYFFPVTSSSPDCAASHRPPRPPATRRILPGK